RGLQCTAVSDAAAARLTLADCPDVVVLDLALPGGAALELLSEFDRCEPSPLMLVIGGTNILGDRVQAARAGARGFLPHSLAPDRLAAALTAALDRRQRGVARLLAVDDDPAILAALHAIFADDALRLTTLAEPLRFWDVLERSRPDLVLLDVDMPDVTGIELCRLVRGDDRWAGLPVLVLTAATDPHTVQEVFSAGADDYVTKPMRGAELRTRVRNRLDRVRLYQALAETDPLTGLTNRRKFEHEMERLEATARQTHLPLTFALLDLDRFKGVNDRYGHAVGDRVLQRLAAVLSASFRADDVIARWGGEEIALGMYGMTRDDGVARVADALAAFRQERFRAGDSPPFRVTFTAGVAEYGVDGRGLHEVYRAADHALYQAKGLTGDRVLPAGWQPTVADRQRMPDVVVVDDDPILTDLLTHALETRGYRVVCLGDGREALRRLTGPDRMRARLILLDVDLPEVNGFDVLRQLRRDGVLATSKVIVLTVRSTEPEVLEALEQGAADHIAKPFSVPVLLQRVRRVIAS
ncbi:response regulator, partial [Frankia sp. CiP3]|uniref:response regulator n=2 Tax=unclassified Frankia TaxID=2632575 RepID=UPI00272DEF70